MARRRRVLLKFLVLVQLRVLIDKISVAVYLMGDEMRKSSPEIQSLPSLQPPEVLFVSFPSRLNQAHLHHSL